MANSFGRARAIPPWTNSRESSPGLGRLDRPVVDRTGLSGRYDFDLEFAPDERLWAGILPRPENSDLPDLFRAVQEQLGLQLEATKGQVEALVIARIERPSEN